MSIEKDLARIATALELIAAHVTNPLVKVEPVTAVAPVVTPAVAKVAAPVKPEPVAAPVKPAVVFNAAPPMTADALNTLLVAEYERLNCNRDIIMEEMGKFGVQSVVALATEHYDALLANIRART